MSYLKCTKLVRDFTGIIPEPIDDVLEDDHTNLGSWYVNMFTVDRRKTLIFMNGRTLMSFLNVGVKKARPDDVRQIFLFGLEQLLEMEEVPDLRIAEILKSYAGIRYAKTDDPSALGNLNDLVYHYKYGILDDGGFAHSDLYERIYRVNRMPQRKLGWRYSVEALNDVLNKSANT